MSVDQFRWPTDRQPDLRDGLVAKDVIDALYAPETLRMDNPVPPVAPTLLSVCAPIEHDQRLIVVVCFRDGSGEPWTIHVARDANAAERKMWRDRTS